MKPPADNRRDRRSARRRQHDREAANRAQLNARRQYALQARAVRAHIECKKDKW